MSQLVRSSTGALMMGPDGTVHVIPGRTLAASLPVSLLTTTRAYAQQSEPVDLPPDTTEPDGSPCFAYEDGDGQPSSCFAHGQQSEPADLPPDTTEPEGLPCFAYDAYARQCEPVAPPSPDTLEPGDGGGGGEVSPCFAYDACGRQCEPVDLPPDTTEPEGLPCFAYEDGDGEMTYCFADQGNEGQPTSCFSLAGR